MEPGEQATGTRDDQYNLISVLYHALQGAEKIEAYLLDAEAAGDERLVDFFRETRTTYGQLAERAKERLGVLEVPPEPEIAPDLPPEGGISPGAMSGGIPPGSADVRKEEAGVPTEEVPPRASTPPRTPPGAALREDFATDPGSVTSADIQGGTSRELQPRDAPSARLAEAGGDAPSDNAPDAPRTPITSPSEEPPDEPGRATLGQQTAGQPEEEKKGLIGSAIDKAADKLSDR